MSLEVYPSDYSTRYQIAHAISVQETIYYNAVGKMALVVPIDDYNAEALRVGSYVYDTERDETYLLVNVKIDTNNNRITANGYTYNFRLNQRIIATAYTMTNIESGAYAVINANLRNMGRLSTATATGLTEATEAILYGGQLLDTLIPILNEAGLGHKVVFDPATLSYTFKVYKGADRTTGIHAVVFSEEQGTCSALTINDDDSTFKNVAYIKYALSDETEPVEIVGTATGDDRREIWLDTGITQSSEETVAECKSRAKYEAKTQLAKYLHRMTFNVDVDASEIGTAYNIGDVVSCSSARFGISFNARITGIKFTLDTSGESTQLVLGDPILTVLGGGLLG